MLSLRPMLTDKLLRVGGRVAHSLLPFDSKYQIILAKKHPLSELLIKDIHVRNCDSGRELTLNLLREKFWIIHAKSLVRKVLLNCSYCKRQRILPTPPLMNDLPAERVSVQRHHLYIQESIILNHCLLNFQEKPGQIKQFSNDKKLYLRA